MEEKQRLKLSKDIDTNPHLIGDKFPYEHFFAEDPLTGSLTPYGKKVASHVIIFFASMAAWGDAANYSITFDNRNGIFISMMIFAVPLTIVAAIFILINVMCQMGKWSRYGALSHFNEFIFMCIPYPLLILILVALASAPGAAISGTGLAMTWICFVFMVIGQLEAFHTFKEADQPTSESEANALLEDDNFLYG